MTPKTNQQANHLTIQPTNQPTNQLIMESKKKKQNYTGNFKQYLITGNWLYNVGWLKEQKGDRFVTSRNS